MKKEKWMNFRKKVELVYLIYTLKIDKNINLHRISDDEFIKLATTKGKGKVMDFEEFYNYIIEYGFDETGQYNVIRFIRR